MSHTTKIAEIGSNANRFAQLMKRAGVGANEAAGPVKLMYGTVTAIDPLKIRLNEYIELSEKQLELTEAVKNHSLEMNFDFSTETASLHSHGVKGPQTITIMAALEVGDKVLLLRWQGGQKFTVIDVVQRARARS